MSSHKSKKSQQKKAEIHLPKPFSYQQEILDSPARYKVLCSGRQIGKSSTCLVAAICGHGPLDIKTKRPLYSGLIHGAHIIWLMPTYDSVNVIWRALKTAMGEAGTFKEVEHRLELCGGSITLKSAAAGISIRGSTFDSAILDEAAHVDEEIWSMIVSPTLATRPGSWVIFASTPAGDNWFYTLFKRAENTPDFQAWQLPSSVSPLITTAFLSEQRRGIPAIVYSQEYEAAFLLEKGGYFKRADFRYYDNVNGVLSLHGDTVKHVTLADCTIYQTIDLAYALSQAADFTVITTSAVTREGDIIILDVLRERFSGADHLRLSKQKAAEYHPQAIYIETIGGQRQLYDEMIRAGLPARAFNPTKDKLARAMPLLARYEAHAVYHPRLCEWLPLLESELLSFPGKSGEHDDMVDTLSMLANVLPQAIDANNMVIWLG